LGTIRMAPSLVEETIGMEGCINVEFDEALVLA